jgi:hypothetical protein
MDIVIFFLAAWLAATGLISVMGNHAILRATSRASEET